MRSLRLVFLIVSLFLMVKSDTEQSILKTKFGLIAGKWSRSTKYLLTANYLGIPYAEPPIGNLRFRSPRPWTRSWSGVRNATVDGPPCVQRKLDGRILGDEDCLYLNVYVPQIEDIRYVNYKLPVLVFIHGGSFNTGSSSSSMFSPVYMAYMEVIIVTINYRLGPFGFFSLGNKKAPGNYGLKDMLQALKWVQENIEDFGGDPKLVTLMGQSAGAGAAHILALSQKTDGLFSKYIIHSGSALAPWAVHPKQNIRESSLRLAERVGCPNIVRRAELFSSTEKNKDLDEQMIECMRVANVSLILEKVPLEYEWMQNPYCIFGPTLEDDSIEDAIISIPPSEIINKHLFRDMPAIIGVVKDEGLLKTREFFSNDKVQKYVMDNFDRILPTLLESQEIITNTSELARAIKDFYFRGNIEKNLSYNITEMVGDGIITWPTYKALKYLSNVTNSGLYFFWFGYGTTMISTNTTSASKIDLGVNHGDELYYLFNTPNDYMEIPAENTIGDWSVIKVMTKMWSHFMKTGVPKAVGMDEWPDYRVHHEYIRFATGYLLNIEVDGHFLPDRMKFWESLTGNVIEEQFPPDSIVEEEEEEEEKKEEPIVSGASYSRVPSSFLSFVTTMLLLATSFASFF